MKKILTIAFTVLLAASSLVCKAQKYEPRDTWPYVNKDFIEGTVRTSTGALVKSAQMNICVTDGKLHYIENDVIMAADMNTVYVAKVGEDLFVNVGGKMMKVLAENSDGALVSETLVDQEQMGKAEIGYGISSATASTQNVTTLVGTEVASTIEMNVYAAIEKKGNGNIIPTKTVNYLRIGNRTIPANKSDVTEQFADKNAAKEFFKNNKIKWNDPQSVMTVVSFIASQK